MAKPKLTKGQEINLFIKKNLALIVIISIAIISIILLLIGIMISNQEDNRNIVYGDDVVVMTYFHLNTCQFCHMQEAFHKVLLERYPQLKIEKYELSSPASVAKFEEIAENFPQLDPARASTPTTIIGDRVNVGYGGDATTGLLLDEMIQEEIKKIEENWDENTMTRTVILE